MRKNMMKARAVLESESETHEQVTMKIHEGNYDESESSIGK